ncbi:MAG: hypothetical protein LH472_08905, partial [Pyrinomonadaceae bacterium]|nr:hypothetical protein [Pyrinomonadaceae bacterium]
SKTDPPLAMAAGDSAGKPKDWQFNENELNLFDEKGNINYEELENISIGIERGSVAITRLNEAEERGRSAGGRRNVEASVILGTNAATRGEEAATSERYGWDDHKQAVKPQEEILEAV